MTAPLLFRPADPRARVGVELHRQAFWLARHRFVRTAAQLQARRGLPIARLLVDPVARSDPYVVHEEIRRRGRLVRTPLAAVTVDHALTAGILRDAAFGVDVAGEAAGPRIVRWATRAPDPDIVNVVTPPSLLVVNPPDHTRYRRLVSKPFTPRALQAVADRVVERCSALLDGLAGAREVDIVEAYASQLPVAVIGDLLGVPPEAHAQLLAWGHAIAPVLDIGISHRQYMASERALADINGWFDAHFARLRRQPGEDILSQLVHADPADRLTDRELRSTALLLLGAGFETTVNLLGNGVAQLCGDPVARARLAADPALWPQAVEELLRLESPVQLTARVAKVDREVDGVTVPAGTAVLMLLGGANRDPGVFPDPGRFDLARPNSKDHVALSGGIHFCLGASLARMEGATALQMLFERFPDLSRSGPGRRRDLQTLRGYEKLPVRLR